MSPSFSTEVYIDASPERVFAAMTDMKSWNEWMSGLVSLEKLTDGEYGVGTMWKETRKIFGRQASEQFEVTRCVRPKTLSLRVDGSKGASRKGEYLFEYEILPEGQGTFLRMSGAVKMPGWFANLTMKLFLKTFKKACDKDLFAMKAFLEKNS